MIAFGARNTQNKAQPLAATGGRPLSFDQPNIKIVYNLLVFLFLSSRRDLEVERPVPGSNVRTLK